MRLNVYKFNLYIFYFLVIFILALLVATRDLSIGGTDPIVYKGYFDKLEYYSAGDRRFEIGYHLFNFAVYKLTGNYQVFLFLFYFIFNVIYVRSMVNFNIFSNNNTSYLLTHLAFLGIILNSSWYISATVNGLRQGFSLVLLYLALSYIPLKTRNEKIKFLVVLIISLTFHESSLLIVPFLFLLLLSLRCILVLFLLFSVFYPLGLNELFVYYLSNLSGVPLHFEISNYAGESDAWLGFQLNFFAYSFFWCIIFTFLHFKYFIDNQKSEVITKILLILTSSYFFYGFGAFSNRFGFVPWLFLPIVQTFYLANLMTYKTKDINIVLLIFLLVLITGIFNYFFLLR